MADLRRRPREPGRLGALLAALGCLGVLGLTFGAGFYTGRYWTRTSVATGEPDPGAVASQVTQVRRSAGAARAAPALTFYEELTAPLASAPPGAPGRPAERANLTEPGRSADRAVASRPPEKANPAEPARSAQGTPARSADKPVQAAPSADARAAPKDAKGTDTRGTEALARRSEPTSAAAAGRSEPPS